MMTKQYQRLSRILRTDLTNQKFGRLLVLKYAGSRRRAAYWLCRCECGTEKKIIAQSLTSGHTKSCGCLCRESVAQRAKTHGKSKTTEALLWYKAKRRAKRAGLEFDLQLDDIRIPETCPLLGIPLKVAQGVHTPNSPSLDRKNSNEGYTKTNVWVISFRANTIKNNASAAELKLVADNLENLTTLARKAVA